MPGAPSDEAADAEPLDADLVVDMVWTVNDQPGSEWEARTEGLARLRAASRAMGGPERLARHRASGKLDARARVAALVDPGTFREIGTLAGGEVPADAIVTGSGLIDGSPVMVGAEDFTTAAGTIGSASNAKRYRLAELALQHRIPLIMLLEGAGYRPEDRRGRTPVDLIMQARCSGSVPIVTGVLGASAGHGALIAPMSDFCLMTEQAAIFTAGPPVVRQSTGEQVSKADLGGPAVAVGSGLVHNRAADDLAALRQIRGYLSYFPSSAWTYPPSRTADDRTAPRPTPELLDLVPANHRQAYDMRRVIDIVTDGPDWFEIAPAFGPAILCVLAHLGGHPVAVVANQPQVLAGAIDADAAAKAARFITVADAFHLPLIFLADNPGMLPGAQSERAGVLRTGARMFAAQTLATTPKIHLTLRKAYGFGSMVMAMAGFDGQGATFAFPGATLGAMGASAHSAAIGAPDGLAETLREAELSASYESASHLRFDELIDPRETRDALLAALGQALSARQSAPEPVRRPLIMP
jgi:acetyl-CoA carboxylase carboxyltransferase component